ncbi:MAG: hypothetical protein IPJ93_15900 [Bacteroidota bacterium]|nr:MAG: hypothetical protein IPJ93_15900 [Bacteroidota bacterium]
MQLRLTVIFFLLSFGVIAQDVRYDYVEDLPLRYTNEYSIGATLHSSGWGFMFRKGKI